MWKTKIVIFLIVSTTANAVTNFDDLSLEPNVGGEGSALAGCVRQDVGDLGRGIGPTVRHEYFFLESRTNGALPGIGFAADVTTQERPAALS